MRGLAPAQVGVLAVLAVATVSLAWLRPEMFGHGIVVAGAWGFLAVAAWRTALILFSAAPPAPPPEPAVWPRYTVLAALHDEAEVVGQLIDRLSRIDYPADRLQGLLVLEAHDHGTIAAALATPRPDWLDVFVVPPGKPQTKPRALNCALAHATGELLTVYDAEDEPDPLQLREAAGRFAADPTGRLACLQAPLRIRRRGRANGSPFLDRQFAAEYASLFETALPGIARLGLPFPLGGTSNHFRIEVLSSVEGWDSWNVTEDADLGFRLWSRGWRLGVISRPTWETPPGGLDTWLPQRTGCVPLFTRRRSGASPSHPARHDAVARGGSVLQAASPEKGAGTLSSRSWRPFRPQSDHGVRVGNASDSRAGERHCVA